MYKRVNISNEVTNKMRGVHNRGYNKLAKAIYSAINIITTTLKCMSNSTSISLPLKCHPFLGPSLTPLKLETYKIRS